MIELIAQSLSLKELNPKDFKNMPRLKYLDLSNNQLSSIIPETFDKLPSLEHLNLRQNKLKFFVKPKIPTLKVLSLNTNELEYLNSITFSMLPELTELDLDNNQLQIIHKNFFEFNLKLKKVYLARNKLRSISPTVFKNLSELDEVDLTGNECIDSLFTETSLKSIHREIREKCASCGKPKTRKNFENLKKENRKLKSLLKVKFEINLLLLTFS